MSIAEEDQATTESPVGKYCTGCFAWRPIEQFRRRLKDSDCRQSRFNYCRNAATAEKAARKVRSRHRTLLREIKRGTPAQAAMAVFECVARTFGGVEGVAAEWKFHFDNAEVGSRWTLSRLAALVKLGVDAATLGQQARTQAVGELGQCSDDEIANELQGEVAQLVEANPELAIAALRRRGYCVTEPA